MKRKVAIISISLLLITLFGYTSVMKLGDYYNFRFSLEESPFIGRYAAILVWAVPASELLIITLLLLASTRLTGLWASFILMFLFTAYIAAMLLSGVEIPCSCGGVLEGMSWPSHLVFNSVFVVLSVVGIFFEHTRKKNLI